MIKWLACFSLSFGLVSATAQRHEQLWLDLQLDYPFSNRYLFEVTGSYQTVLTKENRWRNYSLTPTFEYQLSRRLDLIGTMPIVHTLQKDSASSLESDPALGARLHFTQNRRIDTRLIVKAEQRIFREVETGEWQTSNRIRLKAEAWISINGPNLFTDHLWYGILDYEEFIVTDHQVNERFASRRRGRLGLGYRLNYKNRFEIIYTRQSSRNEIEGGFISGDNVIQLRYKIYLNPVKLAGSAVP